MCSWHDSQWQQGKIQEIMTATVKMESFDDKKENWETYVEWVEQFFVVSDIDDDHKMPTLLSLISGKTYTLLRIFLQWRSQLQSPLNR